MGQQEAIQAVPSERLRWLRAFALEGLARMYLPDQKRFVFRVRRNGTDVVREGVSLRYTAISLLGLQGVGDTDARAVLGQPPEELCAALASASAGADNLGDVALSLWALAAWRHPSRDAVVRRLCALQPKGAHPTVELAWALAALCHDSGADVGDLREDLARRLTRSAEPAGVFPHVLGATGGARGHVSCFADMVYPIQALSFFHRLRGDADALGAARRGASLICRLQGEAGQWWWHYDWRTGAVVEPYPVYAVHQDSMAPMALLALHDAGGEGFGAAIERGLGWLDRSPELGGGSLVDPGHKLIWRKVARREPGKLARYLQAAASRVQRDLRVPGLDTLLPPRAIDYEDRPYHLGWVLYTWFPPGKPKWN